jgi:hypothetical protein
MNIDDSQRPGMMNNIGNSKMGHMKYPEKSANYSPSASYNYSPGAGYNGVQHPRRRTDRFKREVMNQSDRTVKQNDIIIRLLKEIRDRLPPPPFQEPRGPSPDTAMPQGQEPVDSQPQEPLDSQPVDESLDQGSGQPEMPESPETEDMQQ